MWSLLSGSSLAVCLHPMLPQTLKAACVYETTTVHKTLMSVAHGVALQTLAGIRITASCTPSPDILILEIWVSLRVFTNTHPGDADAAGFQNTHCVALGKEIEISRAQPLSSGCRVH